MGGWAGVSLSIVLIQSAAVQNLVAAPGSLLTVLIA